MGMFAQAARELRGYRLEQFSPQSTAYWVAKLFGGGFGTASGIPIDATGRRCRSPPSTPPAATSPRTWRACRCRSTATARRPPAPR